MLRRNPKAVILACLIAVGLAACGGDPVPGAGTALPPPAAQGPETGPATFSFAGEGAAPRGTGEGGVPVNSFLWRASLDTIAFMPLATADPFGGVILTDWYSPDGANTERFKVNVLILDRELRTDALQVSAFRQVFNTGAGGWVDQPVGPETAPALEEAILSRARELRLNAVRAGQQ